MTVSPSSQSVVEDLFRAAGKAPVDIDDEQDSEAFLLDVLDILCKESTPEFSKLQFLAILQEKIKWAVLNVTSAEHVIGSLKNIYLYSTANSGKFYKSQILVTITVVLIMSSSKLQNLQENCETLHSSVQFLTNVISQVNHSPSVLTRKTACECLWEIEISYPGLLQDRLGLFFKLCEEERSVIFQSYMTLFVTTLKNTIVHLSTFHEKFPENRNYLNELLSSETDISMKMNCSSELGVLEEQFPVTLNVGGGHLFDVTLPYKFKDKELKRAVSYIAENCNLLTNMPLFHVLLQLMHCIKLASLSPGVFKSQFVHSLSTTMDLTLFQLLLLLKSTFRRQLIEESGSVILLQRLSQLSNQPHLSIGQRLLCYQWLIHFPNENEAEQEKGMGALAELMDFTQKANFHPTVFDQLEITRGKLIVLSSCYFPGDGPDIATATLMNCLICLDKPIKHGLNRPFASMLFQVLYSYYSKHHDTALVQEIYRFLLSFLTQHPDLVPYILDFALSVSILTPESSLPCDVLRNFTEYIVELPLKIQVRNVRNYLKAFESAMKLKDIPPTGTIGYLRQLVNVEEIYRDGGWSVGNAILLVCRNILQYHDTSKIIAEFGECLLTINKVYNDVDIRDRAMFYYSFLTSISTEKCSRLLNGALTKLGQGLQLYGRSGLSTSAFATAHPIKEIRTPFLSLTRIPKTADQSLMDQDAEYDGESKDFSSSSVEELFSSYLSQIDNMEDKPSIAIPFYLHYNTEPDEEVPDSIFAAVIQVLTPRNYSKIPDIYIPYLSYKNSSEPRPGCQVVEVKFSPDEPVPACFKVRVIYSNTTGCSFIMPLKPIVIQFCDLFIPLGQPTRSLPSVKNALSLKQLFDALWKHIEEHQFSRKNRNFTGAKSIVYLDVERQKVDIILEQLAGHIIQQTDSETLVGVVVTPKHHFLLRFLIHPSHTVVYIETDKWQILGLIAEFLKQ